MYKHAQIGYLMLVVTLVVAAFFVQAYLMALAEPPSVDSGPNLLITVLMASIVFVLTSFSALTVSVDQNYLRLKFGWGIFKKKFPLAKIASVRTVRNHWYCGWGIRMWFWPYMWIYNVSGFDAVEISLKSGRVYRIGTDEPKELEAALKTKIGSIGA